MLFLNVRKTDRLGMKTGAVRGPDGESSRALPLCVDLDGTLLKTDTLVESILLLLRKEPLRILCLVPWMFKSKAYCKDQISRRVNLNFDSLPKRVPLVEYLEEEKAKGRKINLATGANWRIAEGVARTIPLFGEVFASDEKTNLSGKSKLERLTERFGAEGYLYAGNSFRDLPVWQGSAGAIVVAGRRSLAKSVESVASVIRIFRSHFSTRSLFRQIRVHQWVKNTLIFVPLVGAHRITDPGPLTQALLAFISFSLCASCAYVINDILDLEVDRLHPKKRTRPLASGELSLLTGLLLIPVLLAFSLMLATALPAGFTGLVAVYFVLTLGYSISFKRRPVFDVMVLSGLYTIRVFAGEVSTGIRVSEWLFGFSMFIFFSLAMLKRYAELQLEQDGEVVGHGRGYRKNDLAMVGTLGVSSGCIAVLVLALYLNSDAIRNYYGEPRVLWLACPPVLYWISRIWFLARRGQVDCDPILFASKDRITYIVGLLIALIMLLSDPL